MVLARRLAHPRALLQALTLFALAITTIDAGEVAWDERLAAMASRRLQEIGQELAKGATQRDGLPKIPLDDQGGTGGFASMQSRATPTRSSSDTVEIRWQNHPRVDLVALVPARRYDARGLDAQYGVPDAFTVELIDAAGDVLACVAHETNANAQPLRKGHPYIYQVSPPIEAAGLRISGNRLHPYSAGEESFVHAWAEAMVFEGERNIALAAEVRSLGGVAPSAPWLWSPAFLVDGQTPLGLPEIPAHEHGNIGWISEGRANANDAASLTVDLGESLWVDAVRLLPAKKPTSDLPSGFGFPQKLTLSISDSGKAGDLGQWTTVADREMRNPGHNPVSILFAATRGRFLKIEATRLWKPFDTFPAFFALSEVEVIANHHNVALNKIVRSPDGMLNVIAPGGRFWSSAALSDGFGPDGQLVSTRKWLTLLDARLQLETRDNALRGEAADLISDWRRAGLTALAMLGLAGAFLVIVLPIRYRIHARRELTKVRERIAGDLHDEVGSNLGSIQMFADLAAGRSGPSEDLKRIQRIAAETVSAVRDIVWLLRPQGDHRIGTVEHLRETSSIMLETLKWTFNANDESWQTELPDEATRHLFLFFREALHNILRHAQASHVTVCVVTTDHHFQLSIADDGVGIGPDRLARPATLHALRQRAEALNASLLVHSQPNTGTHLNLDVPLNRKPQRSSWLSRTSAHRA